VTQPSLSDFTINVSNPNPVVITPPEVTKILLPNGTANAGETFDVGLAVDGKNGFIYSANANFTNAEDSSYSFSCAAQNLIQNQLQKVWENLVLKCETQRTNAPGVYVLRSINISATSCNVTPNTLYDQSNQGCTQSPRMRNSNYYYQNNYGFVTTSPVVKNSLVNPIDGSQKFALLAAPPLQAPKYTSAVIQATQIKVSYPWTYQISCDYSASSGSVTSGTNDKISNVVTISGLKPKSKVVLSGTCTGQDKAKVSFTETFTTSLPAAPVLPTVLSQKVDLDSVTLVLSDINQSDVEYEVDSTEGSIVIAGDTLEISDLKPGQSTVVTMTMTDAFDQTTSGIIGTFVTQAPPKLENPVVKLVSKKKNNYIFSFNKIKGISYTSRGSNCTVRINGDNITVTSLVPGKTANAYITATDEFGQKATTKFLTAKIVSR
jgi:hypothetical protein